MDTEQSYWLKRLKDYTKHLEDNPQSFYNLVEWCRFCLDQLEEEKIAELHTEMDNKLE